MAEPLVVEQLRKVFPLGGGRHGDDFVAVESVSFSVEAGKSLAIVGESGSGKTTIARMIAGLEVATVRLHPHRRFSAAADALAA